MTVPDPNETDESSPGWFDRPRRLAAVGLTAGLIGGGAAGMLLSASPLSGAAPATVASESSGPRAEGEPGEGESAEGESAARERHAERLAEVLAPLVQDGTIDQAQADAVIQALVDAAPQRPRAAHHAERRGLMTAAEAIGIEPRELADALRGGSTIAQVAQDHGVEVQTVIDAMVADASERLDRAVANGRLSEEEAAQRLAELTERITERVNEGRGDG